MNFLRDYIFGLLEDNTGVFYTHWLIKNPQFSSYVGFPFGGPVDFSNTSEPLFLRGFFFLMSSFDTVVFYNIFILVSLGLVLLSTYFLIKHFISSRVVSFLMALLFVMSPYFFYQARSHVTLIQFWLVVLFIYFLSKSKTTKDFFLLGIYLTFVTLISNYFAFFSLLILGSYFFAKQIVYKLYNLKYWSARVFLNYLILFFAFIFTTLPILFPYFNTFYLASPIEVSTPESKSLNRTLEDFFIFSSRPWYYLLPSVDNPFVGELSKGVVTWMQDDWKYFLTQNHFKSEHTASYLGLINLPFSAIGLYFVLRKLKNREQDNTNELEMLTYFLVSIVLIVLTMPPYITVGGITLYMPSYFHNVCF